MSNLRESMIRRSKRLDLRAESRSSLPLRISVDFNELNSNEFGSDEDMYALACEENSQRERGYRLNRRFSKVFSGHSH